MTDGSSALRVLVVASDRAPVQVAAALVQALEGAGVELRMIDVGRIEVGRGRALRRVLRALIGEDGERKLLRSLANHPPEVTFALDPASAAALCMAREEGRALAAIVAVCAELAPGAEWAVSPPGLDGVLADRYLAVDDEAAVALADHGVPGARVLPVGPLVTQSWADAAREARASLRDQFKIRTRQVVVIDVDGAGYEGAGQLALQMALVSGDLTVLFDAGRDRDAATALRRQVPTLEMRAKLFGETGDAPRLWRTADVIVGAPTERNVARALALGARFVALAPQGEAQERMAQSLVERGRGAIAKTPLLVSAALGEAFALPAASESRDGARVAAEIALVVGWDRVGVIAESGEARARAEREAATEQAAARAADRARATAEARATAAAGGLEDLSGFDDDDGGAAAASSGPDLGEVARRRAEVSVRLDQVKKQVLAARSEAERWDKRAASAREQGKRDLASQAERQADAERRKMHDALQQLAALEQEGKRLEREAADAAVREARPRQSPPPRRPRRPPRSSLEEELAAMKAKEQKTGTSLEAELAALKEKMKRGKP